jgi:hypothetical protein
LAYQLTPFFYENFLNIVFKHGQSYV